MTDSDKKFWVSIKQYSLHPYPLKMNEKERERERERERETRQFHNIQMKYRVVVPAKHHI